jgi:methylmalonyl-CoA/ethylmalonyl-CoA epimerase
MIAAMSSMRSPALDTASAHGQTNIREAKNSSQQQTQPGGTKMKDATAHTGLSTIGQICVNTHDVKKAIEFYRDTLGMKFLFEVPNMAFFDCGGVRLMLALPDRPEFDHPSSIIYYKVPDIQRAYDELTSRGVKFESKPSLIARLADHDLWLADFRDVDNNLLALMSEVPRV